MSYEEHLRKVRKDGLNLRRVPAHLRDEAMCLIAVKQKGENLTYVPANIINDRLCMEALKEDGLNLYWVPKNMVTYELAKCAVVNNPRSMFFVPVSMRTKELCDILMSRSPGYREYVPVSLRHHYPQFSGSGTNGTTKIMNMIIRHIRAAYVNGAKDMDSMLSIKRSYDSFAQEFASAPVSDQEEVRSFVEKDPDVQRALHWVGVQFS